MFELEDRTRVLFAETFDMRPDPSAPSGLRELRENLAALIKSSDDGRGFAYPRTPTIEQLADRELLFAWQECGAATAASDDPMSIDGRECNVAFITSGDPSADASLTRELPWLSAAPKPSAAGRARRGELSVGLFLTASPEGVPPGRYPRSAEHPVVQTSIDIERSATRSRGAVLWFLLAALLLMGSAFWAGSVGMNSTDTPGSDAGMLVADRAALAAVEQAQEAYNLLPNAVTAGTLREASQQVADLGGGYRSIVIPWLIATLALIVLLGSVGLGVRGAFFGFLVDERGRMSLSRFQLVAWTIVIVGGFWTAALWNVGLGLGLNSTSVILPALGTEVWIVLGISTGSPLLSALILGTKSTSDRSVSALKSGVFAPPPYVPDRSVGRRGLLDARKENKSWYFLDLFIGEEVSNRSAVDISRVQQFIFTMVALFAYAALLGTHFGEIGPGQQIESLPAFSEYLVGLLALSHAGYLAFKALPKI